MNTETNTKTVFTWDWILDPGYFQVTCFFYCYFRLRNLRQGDLYLTGWIPLCLPDSARHPGHLCSAGLASLHQVAAGQPGAAGGELSCLSCLLTSTNFPLLSAGPATPRHGSSPTFLDIPEWWNYSDSNNTENNPLSVSGRPTEPLWCWPNIAEQHQSLHRGLERGGGWDHHETAEIEVRRGIQSDDWEDLRALIQLHFGLRDNPVCDASRHYNAGLHQNIQLSAG